MINKEELMSWAKDLFPINRSITGDGVRKTLFYFKKIIPELKVHSIESGTKVFDWTTPNEWKLQSAYIKDDKGNKIIDFKKNNLHVVGYSSPIKKKLNFKELNKKLYSLPELPNAIPYRTSYYKKGWGFCLTENQKKKMNKKGIFFVNIKSKLFRGNLNYGEILLKGKSRKEVLISTNICHPSLANNEISGPVVATALAKLLKSKKTNYTYRIIFVPETIGAITFLKKNLDYLKKNLVAGFVLSCVGDERNFSKVNSRYGNTFADRILEKVFKKKKIKFKKYSFLKRGSDERQFCSPGVDLPICSFMRTKYGEYKEYHTSLDNLNFISKKGLYDSYLIMKEVIIQIEKSIFLKTKTLCEPFLTKYNLKKTLSGERTINKKTKQVIDLIAYADGQNSLEDISDITRINLSDLKKLCLILKKKKILTEIK